MKKLLMFVTALAILLTSQHSSVEANQIEGKATLIINTKQIWENGNMHLAQAPHTVREGVTYISLRTLGEYMGHQVYYLPASKEYGIKNGVTDIKFKLNSNVYTVNGREHTQLGRPFLLNGHFMVPLRTFAETQNYQLVPKMNENKVEIIYHNNRPTGTTPAPVVAVPEAIFTTNKSTYKIGETIIYTDTSKNGGSPIIDRTWQNRESAFFTPGPKTITLQVTNQRGQVSKVSRTINISNEVLYTREEYNYMHIPVGEKLTFDGLEVLNYDMITYEIQEQKQTLFRSNSPERIDREGIYYEDTLSGSVRIDIHKQNAMKENVQLFAVAHNPNDETVMVEVKNMAFHLPTPYVTASGKLALSRYLQAINTPTTSTWIQIPPKQTRQLMPQLSANLLRPEDTVTVYMDTNSSQPVTYQVIALNHDSNFEQVYPFLNGVGVARDGIHTRGTFENGNRTIDVDEPVGTKRQRILFGDRVHDKYVIGIDSLSGNEETNNGNYGVLYNVNFHNVEANTAVILNGRGGQYAGAFLVNGRLVNVPTNGRLEGRNEGVVLYRTGNRREAVNIQFIPAAGSYLPINILFIPIDGPTVEEPTVEEVNPESMNTIFKDNVNGHWANQAINHLTGQGIIKGLDNGDFGYTALATRAQMASFITRVLGLEASGDYKNEFKDVTGTEWFAADFAAAVEAGIVKGKGANRAAPNANVTREEAAVMIVRALEHAGFDFAAIEGDKTFATFKDAGTASSWAIDALEIVVKAEIFNGKTATTFDPKANITRAEIAVVLDRFLGKVAYATEVLTLEETNVEEAVVEETTVEETTVEDTTEEETTTEATIVEEATLEEASIEEATIENN